MAALDNRATANRIGHWNSIHCIKRCYFQRFGLKLTCHCSLARYKKKHNIHVWIYSISWHHLLFCDIPDSSSVFFSSDSILQVPCMCGVWKIIYFAPRKSDFNQTMVPEYVTILIVMVIKIVINNHQRSVLRPTFVIRSYHSCFPKLSYLIIREVIPLVHVPVPV